MLQRFLPQSAHKTTMHYQIFRNKNSPQELFDLVNNMYVQIMNEDKGLAIGVQANLERGLFVNGQMHPRVESAALHLQQKTRETVKAHLAEEREVGRQLWPAHARNIMDAGTQEDEESCAGLACDPVRQSEMVW